MMHQRILAIWLLAAALLPTLSAAEAPNGRELSTKAFLDQARHPPFAEAWTIMKGEAMHYRRNGGRQTYPIQLRGQLSPRRSLLQLIFNDVEWYAISQNFADGIDGGSVLQDRAAPAGKTSLADIGIRPSDLTLGFLYWQLLEELEPRGYKGLHCRVLRLAHPERKERALVWLSSSYFLPVRVQWFKGNSLEPHRELLFKASEKTEAGMYLVKEIELRDQGWRTRVTFEEIELHEIRQRKPPADLFLDPENR